MPPQKPPGPRKPLRSSKASIYWRRRAVALTLLGVLVWVVVGRLLPSEPPSPSAESARATASSTAKGADGRVQKADAKAAREQALAAERAKAARERAKARAREAELKARLERVPKGPPDCAADVLAVRAYPSKAEVPSGFPLPLRIKVLNGSKAACKIVVNPVQVRIVVMSGSDRVWDSEKCPRVLSGGRLTLKPGAAKSFVVVWNGRRGARPDTGGSGGTGGSGAAKGSTKGSAQGSAQRGSAGDDGGSVGGAISATSEVSAASGASAASAPSGSCSNSAPAAKPGKYSVQVAVSGALSDPVTFKLI